MQKVKLAIRPLTEIHRPRRCQPNSERPGYRVRSIVQDEAKFNGALSRYLVRGFAERVLRGWRGKFFPPTSPSDSQAYISQCHLTWWGGVPCAPVIELLLVEDLSPLVLANFGAELRVLEELQVM